MFNYIYNIIFRNNVRQESILKNFILTKVTRKKYINYRNKVIIIQRWLRKYCLNIENIFLIIQRNKIKTDSKILYHKHILNST